MKKNPPAGYACLKSNLMIVGYFFLITSLFAVFSIRIYATPFLNRTHAGRLFSDSNNGSAKEKKVDFLERIYFSGKNKNELNGYILATIQELEGIKPATASIARQYAFLNAVKDQAYTAETSCDVLEILAAGIYGIDANDAMAQQVIAPGEKARTDANSALANINNAFGAVSTGAGGAAYNAFQLSGGSINGLGTAGKIAGASSALTGVIGSIDATRQGINQIKTLSKSLGIGNGDKSCKKVPHKDISIGEHQVTTAKNTAVAVTQVPVAPVSTAGAQTTVISVSGISYSLLKTMNDSLKVKTGVISSERSFSESLSTITLTHTCNTDIIADWIAEKFSDKFKMVDSSPGKINLAQKSAGPAGKSK